MAYRLPNDLVSVSWLMLVRISRGIPGVSRQLHTGISSNHVVRDLLPNEAWRLFSPPQSWLFSGQTGERPAAVDGFIILRS